MMFKMNVNRKLLPMKGHYLLFSAGTAPVVPFMSVYAKQLGFSSVVVGIIYTILPFSGMLAKPLMGAVADRYKCQKIIFLLAQLITAIMFLTMIFLPEVPNKAKTHFTCNNLKMTLETCTLGKDTCVGSRLKNDVRDTTMMCKLSCPFMAKDWENVLKHWNITENSNMLDFTARIPMNNTDQIGNCIYFSVSNITLLNGDVSYPMCPDNSSLILDCHIHCDSYIVNEFLNELAVDDSDVYKLPAFWFLLCVYLIAWLGQAVTVSVADTICFQILGDNPIRYGHQRMFGSLGWGILSILSGYLVDVFSKGRVAKNYGPVFCIGVVILLICIIVSSRIQYTQQHLSTNIIRDIGRLLCNIRIVVFTLWCICIGLCTALIWNFLFWLLEELASQHGCEMRDWIKTIEGLVMGIQCLAGELPLFFLSNWILKRIGHVHAMSVVLLVIGVRFILYSVITNPWHCLPIELLNGITFGLFYSTMTSYASIVAPPGIETTTQGLVGAIFEGIGVSTGSFIGGICFQNYGGSKTFCIYGVSALVVGLLHICIQYLMQNKKGSKEIGAKYSTPQEAISIVNNKTHDSVCTAEY